MPLVTTYTVTCDSLAGSLRDRVKTPLDAIALGKFLYFSLLLQRSTRIPHTQQSQIVRLN